MSHLQEHMLRVTGLAQLVAQAWIGGEVDSELLVRVCLLHDLGNIVKFDLSREGAAMFGYEYDEHWLEVQVQTRDKYGSDAQIATETICGELGRRDVVEVLREERETFSKNHDGALNASPESQIFLYADLRVTPNGITTMSERANDLRARYPGATDEFLSFLPGVEKHIQSMTNIDVRAITEQDVRPKFGELLSVTI